MSRLIDADALMQDLQKWLKEVDPTHPSEVPPMEDIIVSTLMTIEEQPTVEERKTGEWIHIRDEENGNGLYECPICHRGDIHAPEVKVNFCWNCGAKMEGGKDE